MDIKIALEQLDPSNDGHWTNDGLPRLDVVSGLVGSPVKRGEVTDADPQFNRSVAKGVIQSETSGTDTDYPAPVETAPEEGAREIEPEAPVSELDQLTKKAEQLGAELQEWQRKATETNQKVADLSNEHNLLTRQIENLTKRTPGSDTKRIRDYLAMQRKVRMEKAAQVQKFFEETGTTPGALAKATGGKSPLDTALSGRKTPRPLMTGQ